MDADGLLGFNTSENSSDEVIHNGFDENSVQTGADGGLGLNASGDSSDEVVKFCQHDPMGAADVIKFCPLVADLVRGTWPDGSVLPQPLEPLPTKPGACLRTPFRSKSARARLPNLHARAAGARPLGAPARAL